MATKEALMGAGAQLPSKAFRQDAARKDRATAGRAEAAKKEGLLTVAESKRLLTRMKNA